jgi:hypothetical protein
VADLVLSFVGHALEVGEAYAEANGYSKLAGILHAASVGNEAIDALIDDDPLVALGALAAGIAVVAAAPELIALGAAAIAESAIMAEAGALIFTAAVDAGVASESLTHNVFV